MRLDVGSLKIKITISEEDAIGQNKEFTVEMKNKNGKRNEIWMGST